MDDAMDGPVGRPDARSASAADVARSASARARAALTTSAGAPAAGAVASTAGNEATEL